MSTTPETVSRKPYNRFRWIFISVVVVLNLFAIWAAWQDKSWGALGIAYFVGPIANGVLALVSCAAIPFLKRRQPEFSVWRHLVFSFGVPIAAIIIDAAAILSMDLRGC